MKTQSKPLVALITVLLMLSVALALYLLLGALGRWVGDSEAGRMTLILCATLLLSAALLARSLSRRPAAAGSNQVAREAVYDEILAAWSEAHRQSRLPSAGELDEIERQLVLHASRSVLNCYLRLRELRPPFDISDAAVRGVLQRLVSEMRKDLGHQELPWSSAAAAELLFPSRRPLDGGRARPPARYRITR